MPSLRCPRCSGLVETAGSAQKPHCPACNFPYRDSRPTRETQRPEPEPPPWKPPVDRPTGRPIGVTAIAVLAFVGGVGVIVLGFRTAGGALPILNATLPALRILRLSMAASGLVIGGTAISLAVGLFRGAGAAYALQMALVFASLVFDTVQVAGTDAEIPIVRMVLCALFGAYFLTPAVRVWFGFSPLRVPVVHRLGSAEGSTL